MRPVTKRALVTSVVTALLATASILPGNAAMASDVMPTADNAETVSSEPTVGAQTSPDSAEAAAGDPGAPQDVPQEGGAAEGQPEASEPSEAAGSEAEAAQGNTPQGEGAQGEATPNTPAANDGADAPGEAAEASEPEKTNYEVHLGFANWDFRRSFRDYVGSENEDRTSVRELSEGKNLVWYPKQGQNIDVKNPTTLKFGGEVHWLKYGGVLDVKISNPTIDFTNKQLLVDAATKGTLAGGGAKTFTQQALLDLQDLTWEMRDGYLVIASHKPRITQMSKELVGFYHGEVGDPFVATIQLYGTNAKAPEPVLWKIFPDLYKDPGNKPLVDPNEAIVDVNVPDPTLAHCIRWELDLKDSTPITNKVIQTLQSMQCIGINKTDEQKIRSLQGLEGAKNLASIKFSHNAIVDLAPLAGLSKLHTVELDNNAITDLSPLADLTKLETLRVSNNAITTIPNFKKLENLGTIEAANNKIKDIAGLPVGSENLRILNFANNRIEDISPLGENFHTRELYLNDNRISDVTPLKRMRAMQKINVANNFITDPSTFATWPAASQEWFTSLHVSGNRFSDWTGLESLGSKLKDKPAAGQEAQAMNPRTLEEALAADKKSDEPAAPVPPKSEAPNADGQTAPTAYTANLTWGVRDQFRKYLKGFAHGSWTYAEGASGEFTFPGNVSTGVDLANYKGSRFGGKVHFLGHEGLLDITIANPEVRHANGVWSLVADVASRPFDSKDLALMGNPEAMKKALEGRPKPEMRRFTLANLGAPVIAGADKTMTATFNSFTLTAEGSEAFGRFYDAGRTDFDPIVISVGAPVSNADGPKDQTPETEVPGGTTPGDTKPGDNTPGGTTPGDTQPGDNTPGGTTPGDTQPGDNTPGGTKPGDNAPGGTTPGTDAPANPRPKAMTADLNWGIRKSFLDYVTGPIAHGKVEVSEGATGRFVVPLADGATLAHGNFTGAEFKGKVRFVGHGGLLDLTIANPAIVREGQAWKLMADVASRPFAMPGARPGSSLRAAASSTDAPAPARVHLANLGGMNLAHTSTGATVSFSSVELTEQGAQAFGGFYKAGNRALDALTVSLRAADAPKDTPKDEQPKTEEPKENPKDQQPKTEDPKENPKGEQPKDNSSADTTPQKFSPTLTWGVREQFRSYLKGLAKGSWTLSEGATGEFNFPSPKGVGVDLANYAGSRFAGKVHFTGHHGLLDITIANPEIVRSGNTWTLVADVASRPYDAKDMALLGNPEALKKAAEGKAAPQLRRVTLATLSAPVVKGTGKDATITFAKLTLTKEGSVAFGGFYAEGASDFDPITISAGAPVETPKTGDGSTDNNATDDSTKDGPKKNEDPTTKQPNANGGTPDVKKQKKECAVDPHRKRITSGSLSWGVRSSFTTYVRGSIAKGGWNLNGVTWDGSTFNFPVSGGLYNTSTGSGTIYYSGTVQFYGHNGILDLTMSNPAVQINGNSGTLFMTVSGSDTSGNKFNLGRVAFASLGFNGVSASDSGLSFDGASVTLTDTGAKAFAGFYAAGTALDPMSSSASLAPATACDPETGELIEYDAFGDVTAGGAGRGLASTGTEAQALVWMSLMVLALGAAAVGMSGRGVRARQHH